MKTDPESFIRANTALSAPPHVPEIRLYLASEAHELWLKTEDELDALGLPPPFWAFAWAGGQGLARHLIDNPSLVAGKTVLDFASGSGIVAIAASLSGAAKIHAADIDPWAATAARINAAENSVTLNFRQTDLIGTDEGWDVVLAGDVFYDRTLADLVWPWLQALAQRGACVFVGDPGRSYCPRQGLELLATHMVPVTRALEDSEVKRTSVWRVIALSRSDA